MLRTRFALAVVGFCSVVSTHQSIAGPLTSAEVTKVINRVSVIDPATPLASRPVERMDQRRAAREFAAQAIVVQGRRVGVGVSFLVWEGEPGPAIVEAALAEAADLVIVGTRGRNRVERFVLGSVSDHVVRHAPCPVLIVRS